MRQYILQCNSSQSTAIFLSSFRKAPMVNALFSSFGRDSSFSRTFIHLTVLLYTQEGVFGLTCICVFYLIHSRLCPVLYCILQLVLLNISSEQHYHNSIHIQFKQKLMYTQLKSKQNKNCKKFVFHTTPIIVTPCLTMYF